MLDERDEPARHEPPRPNRRAAARHLRDLDDATRGRHLDPTTGARRNDLERLHALPGIDDCLDAIALHERMVALHDCDRRRDGASRDSAYDHPRRMVAPIEDRSATQSGGAGGPAPDGAAVEADLAWRTTRLEQLVAALGLLLERFRGSSPAFGATVFDNLDDPAASNAVLAILVESTADARRDLNAVRRGVRSLAAADEPAIEHPAVLRLRALARSAGDLMARFEEYRITIASGTPPRSPSTIARLHQVVALSVRSLLDIRDVVDDLVAEEGRVGVPTAVAAAAGPTITNAGEPRRARLAALGLPLAGALVRGIGRRRTRLMFEFAGVLVVGVVVLVSALGRGGLPPDSIPSDGLSGLGPGQTGAVALASGPPGSGSGPSGPPSSPGPAATGAPPLPGPSSAPPAPPRATARPTPAPNAVVVAVTKFADRVTAAAGSIDGLLGTVTTQVQDADFDAAKGVADQIAAIALTEQSWLLSHPSKACYEPYHATAMETYGELLTAATTIAKHADEADANAIHNDVAHSHLDVSTLKQAASKAVTACA